jgi:hypothetical protein
MAVDQDLLDRIAASIGDLYREVETALVRTVAAQLRKDLRAPAAAQEKLDAIRRLQASARLILASLQERRATIIREAIARAYRAGRDGAVADLPEKWFPRSGVGQRARAATAVIPNARVVENLAQALHRDVGRVDQNILRAPLDAYRAVQAGAAARIVSGAYTRREASQAAWQRLIDRGIVDFRDRANRLWKLSSYVEMLARTNAQRAAVQGQMDRLESLDIDLVYISDNVQECAVCRPFESKVLRRDQGPVGKIRVEHATIDNHLVTVDVIDTLAGAMARGLFHPNCRHSASAYLPGVTKLKKATEDPDGYKAREKQRYLERRIRAAKEQLVGALTPEAKKAATKRLHAAQADLRAHLAAHPFLKRLTYREQIGAGNIPSARGPKGGPVADLQPPVQETLDMTPAAQAEPAPAPEPEPTPEPEPARAPTLAERVAQGEQSRTELSGGMYGDTHLVTLADGSKAVHKVAKRTHIADDAVDQADAEELGGQVARALGLPAPEVHRVGPVEMWQEFMPGTLAAKAKKPKGYATSDDGWRMAFLDALIDYPDRHSYNWLVHRGRPVSIDHGLAFRFLDRGLNQVMDGRPILHETGPFEKLFMRKPAEWDRGVGEWVDNDLHPDDITEARRRLTALRGEFDRLGRGSWWEAIMARLNAIAPHAKGTKRRIT